MDHGKPATALYWLAIAAVALGAVVLRLTLYNPWDLHHADEFLQYLEQANRLVEGYGIVPWESRDGIRNGLIPQFLALPLALGDLIAPHGLLPIQLARVTFMALCLLALAGAWGLGAARSRRHALVALFAVAVWYDSVFFGTTLLSESAATALIACGAALLLTRDGSAARLRFSGFLLVLGVLVRLQYAPFVAVFVVLAVLRDRPTWRALSLGGLAALALGVTSDLVNGQVPFSWAVGNVVANLGQGRAAQFGEEGPLFYLQAVLEAFGPAAPAVIAAALLAGKRYWPLLAAVAVDLALHSLIGHKEYRFVWLSVFTLLVLAGVGSVTAAEWLLARSRAGASARWVVAALLCAAFLAASLPVGGAAGEARLERRGGAWTMAAHEVAARPAICGLAVPENRADHAPMAFLRRNVPLYVIPAEIEGGLSSLPPELAASANAILAEGELMLDPDYAEEACHERGGERACLLVRPGGCDGAAGSDYGYAAFLRRENL